MIYYIVELIRLLAWVACLIWLHATFNHSTPINGEMMLIPHMVGAVLAFPYNFLFAFFGSSSLSFFSILWMYFSLWALFTLAGVWATRRHRRLR